MRRSHNTGFMMVVSMVVFLDRGTPTKTPKCYHPFMGTPKRDNFGKPLISPAHLPAERCSQWLMNRSWLIQMTWKLI